MPKIKIDIKAIDRALIATSVYVSAVILTGVLIGLWRYGIDLGSVFVGTHWTSALNPTSKGIIAVEGALVLITLGFGGLFVFGLAAMIKGRMNHKQQPQQKTE